MLIRFDYSKIFLLSRGNCEHIVKYLQQLANGRYEKLQGISYLINSDVLNLKENPQIIAEYVALASFRNYMDFRIRGITYLEKRKIPAWVPDKVLLENPLIDYSHPQNIIFKLEEK